jgi:transcription-repair coupling factor (superfamily II helicase)
MHPGAHYRATTSTVQVPIPRTAGGVGAPRIRDVELVQMVANLVTALQGKPQQDIGITSSSAPLDDDAGRESARGGVGQSASAMSSEERQAR